jgi:hypothetical protein
VELFQQAPHEVPDRGTTPNTAVKLAAEMSRVGREALILGGFLAFGIWATWPLATNMFSSLSAVGDHYQHAWMLWWFNEQTFSLENPFFTDHLLAPIGTYLAYGPLMPLVGAVLAPITALFGAGVSRNVASLAIPVLCAYVTYRLALRIGIGRGIAIITGGLYGFSSMLIIRAGAHLNLAAGAIFAPLALLCAVRYYQHQTRGNAALLGGTLGAAVLVDQQTALFAAALSMGYLAAVHLRDRVPARRWLRPLLLAVVVGVVIASPQLLMTIKQDAVDTPVGLDILATSYNGYNTSLLAMLAPSPNLRLAPSDIDELMYESEVGELVPALGWGLLALAVAGLALARRRLLVIGLATALVGGMLLALGPEFTLSSDPLLPLPITYGGQELSGVMPYTWLVRIPGLDELRVAARFAQFALLPAALLAGLGLQALLRRGRVAGLLAIALVALAVLESGWPISRGPQVPLTRDELYAPVKADGSDSIVVDIPLGFLSGPGNGPGPGIGAMEGMYRGTEHGHPIATAYIARITVNRINDLVSHRFYTDLLGHQQEEPERPLTAGRSPDLARPMNPKAGRMDARTMGVGWVVIWPGQDVTRKVRRYVRAVGFRLEHRVDGIELYRAPAGWQEAGDG